MMKPNRLSASHGRLATRSRDSGNIVEDLNDYVVFLAPGQYRIQSASGG
jgi:hypothetical protein